VELGLFPVVLYFTFIGTSFGWLITAREFIRRMPGEGRLLIDRKHLKLEKLTLLIKKMREKL